VALPKKSTTLLTLLPVLLPALWRAFFCRPLFVAQGDTERRSCHRARLANKKAIKQGVLLPALLDFLSGAEA